MTQKDKNTVSENLSVAMNGSVGRRIATNTQMLMGAKALAALIGFVTLIIAAQGLSKPELGILIFLHGYMLFFAEVATFQSWQTMIRYGTEDIGNRDSDRFKKLIRFCLALDFISAALAFFAAAFLFALVNYIVGNISYFQTFSANSGLNEIGQYVYLYCLLVFASQQGAALGVLRLFDRFNILALRALVMPLTRFGGTLIAYKTGAGLEGYLAAWFLGSLLGKFALPLLAIFELKKRGLLKGLFSQWPNLRLKRPGLWPFVWKTNIDSTLAAGLTHLPLILVGPVFGTGYVAIYKIAEEIANLLARGLKLLDQVIYPEFARMVSRGQAEKIWHMAFKTAAILLSAGMFLSLIVGILGPKLIAMAYGPEYGDVAFLAVLLVMAAAIGGIAAPLYPVFYATHRPGTAIKVRAIGLIAYGISFFFLCQVLGFAGAGWAAICGNLIGVALAVYYAKAVLGSHNKNRDE